MKKITLIMKSEMLETIKQRLVKAGMTELSYYEHRSYAPKGKTVWWRGVIPMEEHDVNSVMLEVFLKEAQLGKALHVLADLVDNKQVKAYMSSVEALELRELQEV